MKDITVRDLEMLEEAPRFQRIRCQGPHLSEEKRARIKKLKKKLKLKAKVKVKFKGAGDGL